MAIPRGAYPCAYGHVWGGGSVQQVAARWLALANDHEAAAADPSLDPAVLAVYRERLEELWAQRQELAGRLKWWANTPV